jgi:hypothetical protein
LPLRCQYFRLGGTGAGCHALNPINQFGFPGESGDGWRFLVDERRDYRWLCWRSPSEVVNRCHGNNFVRLRERTKLTSKLCYAPLWVAVIPEWLSHRVYPLHAPALCMPLHSLYMRRSRSARDSSDELCWYVTLLTLFFLAAVSVGALLWPVEFLASVVPGATATHRAAAQAQAACAMR